MDERERHKEFLARTSLLPVMADDVLPYFKVYGIVMFRGHDGIGRPEATLRVPGSEDFTWSTATARNTVGAMASLACKYDMRPWDFRSLLCVGAV